MHKYYIFTYINIYNCTKENKIHHSEHMQNQKLFNYLYYKRWNLRALRDCERLSKADQLTF